MIQTVEPLRTELPPMELPSRSDPPALAPTEAKNKPPPRDQNQRNESHYKAFIGPIIVKRLSRFFRYFLPRLCSHHSRYNSKGKIPDKDDFKHLARKLTHQLIEAEKGRGGKFQTDEKMEKAVKVKKLQPIAGIRRQIF